MSQTKQLIIIVVKHHIINKAERFNETSENKKFGKVNLSQAINFSINSAHSDKTHAEIKSGSEINLDQTDKSHRVTVW